MHARHLLLFSASVLLAGCAALFPPPQPEPQRDVILEPREDDTEIERKEAEELFNPDALGAYEISTIQASEFTTDEAITLTRLARARIFASVIESLELAEHISGSQREKLYNSLFNNIPPHQEGTFMAVAVGQFFDSGEPLYILLGVGEPTDRAPSGTTRTFLIQSSALGDGRGIATYAHGRFVDMTVNVSWVYHIGPEGYVRQAHGLRTPFLVTRGAGHVSEGGGPESTAYLNEYAGSSGESIEPGESGESVEPAEPIESSDGQQRVTVTSSVRVRLAGRIMEQLPDDRVSIVPRLIEPTVRDNAVSNSIRAKALYIRFLYELYTDSGNDAAKTIDDLEELVSADDNIDERLEYRVRHVLPIMLESLEYGSMDG